MRVAIAGGNGFVGRELTRQLLADGHDVVWLSHRTGRVTPPANVREVAFDPGRATEAWRAEVALADAVVNLSGYPIASRWNEAVMAQLRSSRIDTNRALSEAACAANTERGGPSVFVTASGIGIYSDRGDDVLAETARTGGDWLADLAVEWEAAAGPADACGIRTVAVRTGLVLGDEGLVPKLKTPMLLFVGGPVGTGRQWVPWIHHRDIAGIYRFAIENAAVTGPINACAPGAVRMSDFMRTFGRVLHRPSWLPVPEFGLRLVLGEVAPYTVMSQHATSAKIVEAGYRFEFPGLGPALTDVLKGTPAHH